MCGIVGAVSERNIEKILLNGLKRLEYRGYDSAGIALITADQKLNRLRIQGKVQELEKALDHSQLQGTTGITHTRWATHGAPSEENAHPFISHNQFAIVHNGIIENHDKLRQKLSAAGYQFTSQTDSEVIVHLLHSHFQKNTNLIDAIQKTAAELVGAYALGIICLLHPEHIFGVRRGSPLVVGKGTSENYLASDSLALLPITNDFIYLEEGDIADITADGIAIYNSDGLPVERKMRNININAETVDRGSHRHFMSKEIFEQPKAIQALLEGRLLNHSIVPSAFTMKLETLFKKIEHIQLVACGTSFHAASTARYWIEQIAGIACSVDIASEFRYRHPFVPKNSLFVTLSQSGETADTLAALKLAQHANYLSTLAICNVAESSLVRESYHYFMTCAGAEIGVASTKAFTTQLVALLMLTIAIGRVHQLSKEKETQLTEALAALPDIIQKTLALDQEISKLAALFIDKEHALFLGRGAMFPIALEGALKLKEISYIHAEGYPAGELKHGPLALVDKKMPVIVLAPSNELLDKVRSNLQEVSARGGELFILTDDDSDIEKSADNMHVIHMPKVDPVIAPIVYTIPLQLLAYHVAVLKGTDVDQPRNLAKSVTVE